MLSSLQSKLQNLLDLQDYLASNLRSTDLLVSCQSADHLEAVAESSVDYVFTDPPYSGKVQYAEANFGWEQWLDADYQWWDEEVIVSERRGKSEQEWQTRMLACFKELYRVLKPGRWVSVCFHDASEGSWAALQDVMAESGFLPDNLEGALYLEYNQLSYKQYVADTVVRRDLVINFRKPAFRETLMHLTLKGDEHEVTFAEKVKAIVIEYLDSHPGATKDRIYDFVISRMVRSGQMEVHNFENLLNQVAEPVREPVPRSMLENEPSRFSSVNEIVRWYLKESEEVAVDKAESAKEDMAADSIGEFIAKRMRGQPWLTGVHYSDIFQYFVYAVKDKPRRPLAEWLLDYFFKTEEGTYRLPNSEAELAAKAELRIKGTSRRMKQYIQYLQAGAPIPATLRPSDATLAEWIRLCKRSGMYEQGRFLYEKGGLNLSSLSEQIAVAVEEDYQVCVRLFSRSSGAW